MATTTTTTTTTTLRRRDHHGHGNRSISSDFQSVSTTSDITMTSPNTNIGLESSTAPPPPTLQMISDALQDGEIDEYGSCNSIIINNYNNNNNNSNNYNYTYAYNPSRELFYNDDEEEKKEVDLLEESYHHHQPSESIFFSIHGTASSFEEESSFNDDDEEEEDFFANTNNKGKGRRAYSFWIYVWLTVVMIVGLTVTGQHLRATAQSKRRKRSTTKPRLHFRHVIRDEPQQQQQQQQQQHDDVVYRFKIVQLADLHLGGEVGGTETDAKTYQLIDTILKAEHPDLIVLSGDQISADHLLDNAVAYYQSLGEYLTTYGIPWCMIFGDSDDADYHIPGGNSNETLPAKYYRNELLQFDMDFPLSLTQRGPDTLFGMTNYILTVYVKDDDNDDDVPAAAIYLLDSGGGSLPAKLRQNQIDWFYNSDGRLPAVAFQHYPTREFQFQKDKCMGHVKGEEQEDEEVTTATDDATAIPLLLLQQEQQQLHQPSKKVLELEDPGIANAMSESARVYFLAVGHDHGNDYCCPFTDWLQVCYGRQSGHGGDGDGNEHDDGKSSTWERGARVYELEIQNVHDYKMQWKSWVRLESGTIQDPVTMNDMIKARTKKEPF
jgi:hypothetical protein